MVEDLRRQIGKVQLQCVGMARKPIGPNGSGERNQGEVKVE